MLNLNNYDFVESLEFNGLNYLLYESKQWGEYDTLILLQETCQILEARSFEEVFYAYEEDSFQQEIFKAKNLHINIISGWNMEEGFFFHIYVNHNKWVCDDNTNEDWRVVADFCNFYDVSPKKAMPLVKLLIKSGLPLYREWERLEVGYPAKWIFDKFGNLKEV